VRYPGEEMAKRPDYAPEKPYTPEQLSEIRRNFAMLSKPSLQTAYAEALERCKLARDGRPPKVSGESTGLPNMVDYLQRSFNR
jgi:hypothetical protein